MFIEDDLFIKVIIKVLKALNYFKILSGNGPSASS